MQINPAFAELAAFPFPRLRALLRDVEPPADLEPIDMSIGEPRHAPPPLLAETVAEHAHLWNRYPPPAGTPQFREACCAWLERRYDLPTGALNPETDLLPLAGTKEGLFLAPQLVAGRGGTVLMPDPVYSVYFAAARFAGLDPLPLPARAEHGFLPDLDALSPALLSRTRAFYLCSPSNPEGAVADETYLHRLLELSRRHDFLLLLDECYSDIYFGEPPPGGLQVALRETGSLNNLLVFHSLSKRSSAPGLRSGFVAGDAGVLRKFLQLRAYGGAVQPLPLMAAAARLWQDGGHVEANRELYRRKFACAEAKLRGRLPFRHPQGGIFLWLELGDGERMARRLWSEAALRVLPGAFLSATTGTESPGFAYVRLAMVDSEATIAEAMDRLLRVTGA